MAGAVTPELRRIKVGDWVIYESFLVKVKEQGRGGPDYANRVHDAILPPITPKRSAGVRTLWLHRRYLRGTPDSLLALDGAAPPLQIPVS